MSVPWGTKPEGDAEKAGTSDQGLQPASAIATVWSKAPSVYVSQVLRGLSTAEAQQVMGMTEDCVYPSNSCIFELGDRQQGLYLVKKGLVEEYRLTEEGRKLPINRIGPGKLFALSSLDGRYCCYAETIEDSLVGFLSFQRLGEISRRFPRVALNIVEILVRQLGELENRLERLVFGGVGTRVAWALLGLYDIHGSRLEGVTHEALSTWAASSRPKVSQVLEELQQAGLLRLSRGSIEIRDPGGLERWAKRETDSGARS